MGDSGGTLHWLRQAAAPTGGAQASPLHHVVQLGKLRVTRGGSGGSGVIGIEHVPFCGATDTPLLVLTTRGSAIIVVKLLEVSVGVCVRVRVYARECVCVCNIGTWQSHHCGEAAVV